MLPYFKSEVVLSNGKIYERKRNINAKIEVELKNQNGKVLEEYECAFNSFTLNFVRCLRYVFLGENVTFNSIIGSSYNVQSSYPIMKAVDTAKSSFDALITGIGVFFGDTSGETPSNLLSIRSNINPERVYSSDNMLYGAFNDSGINYSACSITRPVPNRIVISRTLFNNVQNVSIYVNEIGLITNDLDPDLRILIARDFITDRNGQPIRIEYGHLLTVRYVFEVNMSNSFTNNFIGILFGLLTSGSSILTNTVGSNINVNFNQTPIFNLVSPDNDKDFGLVLNEGDSIFNLSYNAFKLISPLTSSHISYNAVVQQVVDNEPRFGLSRIFENTSENNYNKANGFGLIAKYQTNYYLIAIDKLSSVSSNYVSLNPYNLMKINFILDFPPKRHTFEQIVESEPPIE